MRRREFIALIGGAAATRPVIERSRPNERGTLQSFLALKGQMTLLYDGEKRERADVRHHSQISWLQEREGGGPYRHGRATSGVETGRWVPILCDR